MNMFLAVAIYFLADGSLIDYPSFVEDVTYEQCMTIVIGVAETMMNNPEMGIINYAVNCHPMNSVPIF